MIREQLRLAIGSLAAGSLILAGSLLAASSGRAESATPEPAASLTLQVRTCAAGFDPTAAGADPVTSCIESAGDTNFTLSAGAISGPSASTGTSGDVPQDSAVRFENLAPGRYTISAKPPAEIASAFIWSCQSSTRSFVGYPFVPFARVTDGSVTLDLVAGESLTCSWFQIEG